MHFTEAQLTSLILSYLLPFVRIAALLTAAPLFGARIVSPRLRMAAALILSAAIAPIIPALPAADQSLGNLFLVVVQQILIGAAMGFALQMIFAVFVIGAQIISMQMGLGFAAMMDPQSGTNVPVLGQFYTILVSLVFLAMDGHLILVAVLVESFHTLPIAVQGISTDALWRITSWASQMFAGAVLVSLPAVAALLLVNIAFGVMTRAAPQLNIFAVGFPITLALGFAIVLVSLPALLGQVDDQLNMGVALIRALGTRGP